MLNFVHRSSVGWKRSVGMKSSGWQQRFVRCRTAPGDLLGTYI